MVKEKGYTVKTLRKELEKLEKEGKGNWLVVDSEDKVNLRWYTEGKYIKYNNIYYGVTTDYIDNDILDFYENKLIKVLNNTIRFY